MAEPESEKSRRRRELQQAIEELLYAHPKGLTAAEIAFYLNVERTNIYRILPKLEDIGILLWEDENKRYGIFEKKAVPAKTYPDFDKPIRELRVLLDAQDNAEAKYQRLFQKYPWIFGTYYKEIKRHDKFDDVNIPVHLT